MKYFRDLPSTKFQTVYQEAFQMQAKPFLLKPEKKREYAPPSPEPSSPKILEDKKEILA